MEVSGAHAPVAGATGAPGDATTDGPAPGRTHQPLTTPAPNPAPAAPRRNERRPR